MSDVSNEQVADILEAIEGLEKLILSVSQQLSAQHEMLDNRLKEIQKRVEAVETK